MAEEVGWREIALLTLHLASHGMRSAGPQGTTGRPGANPTTGREKGAFLQT